MNIGDVITTAREAVAAEAVELGAIVVDQRGDAFKAGQVTVAYMMRHGPLTVVALPGHLPRPERVVKAEALREAAAHIKNLYATPLPPAIVHSILHGLAAYAEAREA